MEELLYNLLGTQVTVHFSGMSVRGFFDFSLGKYRVQKSDYLEVSFRLEDIKAILDNQIELYN